jgi:iron complex transport system substrate-binding protein
LLTRHHRKSIVTPLLGLGLLLLLSCTQRNESGKTTTGSLRRITDETGRTIDVPSTVERFISLAPNLTEIVFAVGAGDRLVGRTSYCNYPAEAQRVEDIGDTIHPSIERIIALRPQLVLVSTASQLEAFTRQMNDHNIAVYVTDPHNLEDVFRSIASIGELLGRKEPANKLVEQLRARTAAVENAVKPTKPVSVFYQLSAEPLYTAGHDSFVNDVITRAGGISVTKDVPGAWPKYSGESAFAARPEAIILPTGGSMGAANSTIAKSLAKTPAALNGRVYKISDDFLTRPGPRSVDGLEALARALHPEAFK